MRVFWHNGALQIIPEGKQEADLLCALTDNLKIGKPPEMQKSISGGESPLGSEDLFEAIVGNEKASPRGLSSKPNNKQFVVCIDKRA